MIRVTRKSYNSVVGVLGKVQNVTGTQEVLQVGQFRYLFFFPSSSPKCVSRFAHLKSYNGKGDSDFSLAPLVEL